MINAEHFPSVMQHGKELTGTWYQRKTFMNDQEALFEPYIVLFDYVG